MVRCIAKDLATRPCYSASCVASHLRLGHFVAACNDRCSEREENKHPTISRVRLLGRLTRLARRSQICALASVDAFAPVLRLFGDGILVKHLNCEFAFGILVGSRLAHARSQIETQGVLECIQELAPHSLRLFSYPIARLRLRK